MFINVKGFTLTFTGTKLIFLLFLNFSRQEAWYNPRTTAPSVWYTILKTFKLHSRSFGYKLQVL
jgi:hypothetical protein